VPAPGVKISKIKNLEDDIALSLSALGIRIIAPIPGKGTIGIEVPNKNKQIVSIKEVLSSEKFINTKMALPIALGKTISNEVFVADLAKMPHLLVAGATGQGKSVGINAILMSLLYKKHPSQVKLVLIDPKKVELFPYGYLDQHYLAFIPDQDEPIITETSKVINTLNSLCIEMDNRYDLLKKARVRNLNEYNEKFIDRKLSPKDGHKFLPYIVLVIDEFADLIMTAGKEVELPIARLAQLARAIGIHLIIATQRPSVNIITGIIKANFPARLAFKVTSKIDSRTILDGGGADQLIGMGDMLLSIGSNNVRIQCAFVDTPEVESVIKHIADQPGFAEPFYLPEYKSDDETGAGNSDLKMSDLDENFDEAARLIISAQHGSTSLIQRKMQLGYNRAGRIMDQMEQLGIVGPAQGSKPREVLFYSIDELNNFLTAMRNR
jgi:S-DNA-T family DNA segregation ATPase FtsK/SpoIIIE